MNLRVRLRTTPSHRTRRTWGVAAAAALALVVSGIAAASPVEARSGRVPGDQPLPGYTISNPPLAPLLVQGRPARVLQGVHQHAAYDVEIPPRWNGELVMWAHGYRGTGKVLTVDTPSYGLRQKLLDQGYAWAASSYAQNDYDVATGVTTTHGLARYAERLIGKRAERVYVAGVSMGGHVIGRSLEQYPRFYDGALPMCGVLGDQRLFDFFLGYNLVAQDLANVPAYPFPANYLTAKVPQIQQNLGLVGLTPAKDTTNARGKQLRAITTNLSGGERPGATQAFAIWKDFLFTLGTPDNGGPLSQNAGRVAQNLGTQYEPNTPVDVNSSVLRVAARDQFARRTNQLTQIPKIQGKPRVPVLTLHGLGDLFVPFSMEQIYRREVGRHGQSALLVQRAIREAGHCEFTPNEVGRAWDDLTTWVESRDRGHGHRHVARPAGDDVLSPATVASPTYGCRFTDPTGYQSPTLFPTRALYSRCP
jgi:pimeloyl-ACP methyl ester carboxylesterase